MITGHVTGDASMLLWIRSRGLVAREELKKAVETQGLRLLRLVKLKVSGPVLKNRTGTLRRKLNVRFGESANEVTASVGLKLAYAAAHEYGVDKLVTVREHLRQVKLAWGRPIAPVNATVHAHQRHMKLPERSYLRSTLREEGPAIREALGMAVRRAFV